MTTIFKEGDRVKVLRTVFEEPGWDNVWVDEMNDAVGNVYTVSYVNEAGVHFVEQIDNFTYGFPPSSLEIEGIRIPSGSETEFINLNFEQRVYPVKCVKAFEYSGEVFNTEAAARKAALVDMFQRIFDRDGFSGVQLQKMADKAEKIKEAIAKACA